MRPNTVARAQYEQYLKDALSAPSVEEQLRLCVISYDANNRLLNYLSARAKASFQGRGAVRPDRTSAFWLCVSVS